VGKTVVDKHLVPFCAQPLHVLQLIEWTLWCTYKNPFTSLSLHSQQLVVKPACLACKLSSGRVRDMRRVIT